MVLDVRLGENVVAKTSVLPLRLGQGGKRRCGRGEEEETGQGGGGEDGIDICAGVCAVAPISAPERQRRATYT